MSLLLALLSMGLEARKPSAAQKASQTAAHMEAERQKEIKNAEAERLRQENEHKEKLAALQKEHEEKQRRSAAAQNAKAKKRLETELTRLAQQIAETKGHIAANQKKLEVLTEEAGKIQANLSKE